MSSDRLTQLQDLVISMAEQICNSTGILQKFAQPLPFDGSKSTASKNSNGVYDENLPKLYAQLLSQTAKDIDYLVQSLPTDEHGIEYQQSQQYRMLQQLEKDSDEATKRLESVVHHCEKALENVRYALHQISEAQLKAQAIDAEIDD